MANFDVVRVLDTSATASDGAIQWVELPPGISNLSVRAVQSGTASVLTVFQAVATAGAATRSSLFTLSGGETSTLHVMAATANPRYLGVVTSATMDSHITIDAHFVKS